MFFLRQDTTDFGKKLDTCRTYSSEKSVDSQYLELSVCAYLLQDMHIYSNRECVTNPAPMLPYILRDGAVEGHSPELRGYPSMIVYLSSSLRFACNLNKTLGS